MSIFEPLTPCGCGKPGCYFCWLKGKAYTTTAAPSKTIEEKPVLELKTPEDVLLEVCRLTGVTPELVKSPSRKRDIVIVRQIYCLVARKITGAMYKEIGKVIGGRHHATILAACRTAEDNIENDKYTKEVYKKVKSVLVDKLIKYVGKFL